MSEPLKGRLTPGPATGPQLGALGEYRVDGGLWRAITAPTITIGDGEHWVEVKFHGWCEYMAVLRGEGGAADATVVPLAYKEPKDVPPPLWTNQHRVTVDTDVLKVRYIKAADRH